MLIKYFVMNDRTDVNAGYTEVTAEEFKNYQNSEFDEKVYVINLGYAVMETTKENYLSFYKERRRRKYVREETERIGGLLSLNTLDSEEFNGTDVVVDISESFEDEIERKLLVKKIPMLLSILTDSEKLLITQLYMKNMTEKMLAITYGVHQTTISRRKENILRKLKNFFEN